MVDLTTIQAQAKGASPSVNRNKGQTEAAAAKPLNVLSLPPADRVDKLYHQLVEIHNIAVEQLAECTHQHRSDPTSGSVQARTGWQGHTVEPSVARVAPPPPTDFSPQALQW
jgi:hypothetical protein